MTPDERIKELEAALLDIFALMDEGYLVRDTSHDGEQGWALRQLPFVQRLAKAAQLVHHAT